MTNKNSSFCLVGTPSITVLRQGGTLAIQVGDQKFVFGNAVEAQRFIRMMQEMNDGLSKEISEHVKHSVSLIF